MDISFSIQNPNSTPPNQAVLYRTEKNTLDFVFTNNAQAPTLQKGDIITLIIPSRLLVSASPDNLGSPDWTVQSFNTGGGNYTFNLSPKTSVQWDGNQQITISLINLKGGKGTNDNVSANYNIQGGNISGSSVKLSVLAPPDQPKDLNDVITFSVDINLGIAVGISSGQVYISPVENGKNQLAVPIANTIHVNLKYNGMEPLSNQGDHEKPQPKFSFSFATGNSSIDLTDDLKSGTTGYDPLTSAWNIMTQLGDDETNQWQSPAVNSAQTSPGWKVLPVSGNTNLFSSETPNLDVIFTHVISILPQGDATLYIQWANIPGYNDGIKALNLPKNVAAPKIESFTGPSDRNNPPKFGDKITLNWETFGVAYLKLSWDRGHRTIKNIQAFDSNNPQLVYNGSINTQDNSDFILDSLETELTLTAYDNSGNKIDTFAPDPSITFDNTKFPSPTIDEFSGSFILDGNNTTGISFSGKVSNLGNSGVLSIDGVQFSDPGQYNGFPFSKTIPHDGLIPLDHTLEANQKNDNANEKASETITLPTPANLTPIITSFTAAINPDGINVILTWQVQNAVYSGNNPARSSSCEINGTNYGLDSNGHGSATLPISFDGYNLKASNPGAGSAQKTLMPSFSWGAPRLSDGKPFLIPSFAVFKGKLYCVYMQFDFFTDTSSFIVMEYDGQNWSEPQKAMGQPSNFLQPLAVFNDTLYCMMATSPDINSNQHLLMIYTTDGINWEPGNALNQTTSGVFSLAAFGNYLYCAFSSPDEPNTILMTRMDAHGNWTSQPSITDKNYITFSLAVFNNTLYCAYTDTNNNLLLSGSADGASWNSVPNPNQSSPTGPSLAALGNYLYCAYSDGDGNIFMTQMDNNGKWTYIGQVGTANHSFGPLPPSLAVFDQKLYCAYCNNNSNQIQIVEFSVDGYQ